MLSFTKGFIRGAMSTPPEAGDRWLPCLPGWGKRLKTGVRPWRLCPEGSCSFPCLKDLPLDDGNRALWTSAGEP